MTWRQTSPVATDLTDLTQAPRGPAQSARVAGASAQAPTACRKCEGLPPRRRRAKRLCQSHRHTTNARRTLLKMQAGARAPNSLRTQHLGQKPEVAHTLRNTPPRKCSRAHRALHQPRPACRQSAQAPREPAQQRARCQSQCTHANRPPRRAAHCWAECSRAAPRRRHTQGRAASFTSGADHQEPTRSALKVCSTLHSFECEISVVTAGTWCAGGTLHSWHPANSA